MSALAEKWKLDRKRYAVLYGEEGERSECVIYDPYMGIWAIFGYHEAVQAVNDPAVFSSDTGRLIPERREFDEGSIDRSDPPQHTALRKIINHAFTPRAVEDLIPRVHAVVKDLLDKVDGEKSFDFISSLAYPLPITVIAELLGIPASDYQMVSDWVDKMLSITTEYFLNEREEGAQQELTDSMDQVRNISNYLKVHAQERRKKPGTDLVSRLVEAEVDGERLSDNAVANFANVMLVAGHVTTTLLLSNALLCLDCPTCCQPVQPERVVGDWDQDLRAELQTARTTGADMKFPRVACALDSINGELAKLLWPSLIANVEAKLKADETRTPVLALILDVRNKGELAAERGYSLCRP